MGGALRGVLAPVVNKGLRGGIGRRGQVHQPGGPEAIVGVDVPFIAEGASSLIQRGGLARRQAGHPGVAPESELAVGSRHCDISRADIDGEQLSGQRVLRLPAVRWRAEPRIHPGTRPGRWVLRIRGSVVMRLLVGHQRPVGGVRSVDARFPPGLPEDLVPAEEREVHPGVASGLDVRALLAGPVLVVASRKEDLVVEEKRPSRGDVKAARVAHVVPIGLHKPDHGVFGVHEPARAVVIQRRLPRPVVRHFGGAFVGLRAPGRAVGCALVEAVAGGDVGPGVVGLPGLIRGLEQHVGVAGVVADDERDETAAARVIADQMGEVQAGHRGARHRPRGRHGPVAAVDEPGGRGVVLARRLGLRERGGRKHPWDHLVGTIALVVPKAQDVDVVRACRGVDLEGFGFPGIHAHRRGEALDRRVPCTAHLPVARRVASQSVLAGDHADHRWAARPGRSSRSRVDNGEQADKHYEYEANYQAWRPSPLCKRSCGRHTRPPQKRCRFASSI